VKRTIKKPHTAVSIPSKTVSSAVKAALKARNLRNQIPKTIKIGHLTFNIIIMKEEAANELALNGDCNYDKGRIRLCPTLRGTRLIEVLIHEILHAIYKQRSLEEGDNEERIVMCISIGITAILKDNPKLGEWINAMLCEG